MSDTDEASETASLDDNGADVAPDELAADTDAGDAGPTHAAAQSMEPYTAPKWLTKGAPWVIALLFVALIALFMNGPSAVSQASEVLPGSVDRLVPVEGSEVLVQSSVGVDVAEGYTASLTVDGTLIDQPLRLNDKGEIDGTDQTQDGLVTNPQSGLIMYTPRKGGLVESLKSGKNCMSARVWKIGESSAKGDVVAWCINAT